MLTGPEYSFLFEEGKQVMTPYNAKNKSFLTRRSFLKASAAAGLGAAVSGAGLARQDAAAQAAAG